MHVHHPHWTFWQDGIIQGLDWLGYGLRPPEVVKVVSEGNSSWPTVDQLFLSELEQLVVGVTSGIGELQVDQLLPFP